MVRKYLLLLGVLVCPAIALAAFYEIGPGEYDHGSLHLVSGDSLLITGGGAYEIWAEGTSYVEVQDTAPYKVDVGGIGGIDLDYNSSMNYYGGATAALYIYGNATAVLQGGSINIIRSFQDADDLVQVGWDYENDIPIFRKHIEMIVKEKSYNLSTKMLTGLWADDTAFSIQLHDQAGYDPTIENITFTMVPEPATLAFLSLGMVFLIRQKSYSASQKFPFK